MRFSYQKYSKMTQDVFKLFHQCKICVNVLSINAPKCYHYKEYVYRKEKDTLVDIAPQSEIQNWISKLQV